MSSITISNKISEKKVCMYFKKKNSKQKAYK
jgi:hypothetical protein